MFSDHLKKVDEVPSRAIWGVAAGIVFACQLAALIAVVDGQVEKAGRLQAQQSSAQMALADCAVNHSGAARRQCVEQVNADLDPAPEVRLVTEVSEQTGASLSAGNAQGFMQTTFASPQ